METRRDASLDGLRAVAVLAVVAHHGALLPAAIGAHGVDLFFVLSGWCLTLPALRAGGKPLEVRRFFVERLTRIVPPYYVALAIFFALSFTPFGTPTNNGPTGWRELVSEALFYTGAVPTYNTAFWSLGVEAAWYLLLPLVFLVYLRSKVAFGAVGLAAYAAYAWQPGNLVAGSLPCFMLGIVAANCYVRGAAKAFGWIPAAVALLTLAIALDPGTEAATNHGDPLWHLASLALAMSFAGPLVRFASWSPLAFVGRASFAIYLVHQPIIFWLGKHHVSLALASLVATLAGIAFWRAVEVPALAWRKRVLHRIAPATETENEKARDAVASLPTRGEVAVPG